MRGRRAGATERHGKVRHQSRWPSPPGNDPPGRDDFRPDAAVSEARRAAATARRYRVRVSV